MGFGLQVSSFPHANTNNIKKQLKENIELLQLKEIGTV